MFRKILLILAAMVLVWLMVPVIAAQDAGETDVQFIEIVGPAAIRDAEISSLEWYGDWLLLITENPFIYASDGDVGKFFALAREDILEYLVADAPEPLEPRPVPLFGSDIVSAVGGFGVAFDGFESAVVQTGLGYFTDDHIYLTIEADTVNPDDPTMRTYVISGSIQSDLSGIQLDLERFIEIPRQTDFNNMSHESLLLMGDNLVAIYEANGVEVNAEAIAYQLDLNTGDLSAIPLANVPYRITDVTAIDENGVFWAINYFFAGEDFLATDSDPIFEQYGIGASQAEFDGFERLIAFQYGEDGIELADRAPIQLLMTEESNGRNWEGIVRLDDTGFLIATDKYPATLLGFVPAD